MNIRDKYKSYLSPRHEAAFFSSRVNVVLNEITVKANNHQ